MTDEVTPPAPTPQPEPKTITAAEWELIRRIRETHEQVIFLTDSERRVLSQLKKCGIFGSSNRAASATVVFSGGRVVVYQCVQVG